MDSPATEVIAIPTRSRPAASRDDPLERGAVWLRVGVPGRDPDGSPGDRAEGPPDDDSQTVSVADVEAELDGLDVEVEAVDTDPPNEEHDLQRVVDHYERLIAERDRAIRAGRATITPADHGPLTAVRSRLHEIATRLRR